MNIIDAEPNWSHGGYGQPKIEKTEMKPKQDWFCLLVVLYLFLLSALYALVIYSIFYWPLEFRFLFLFLILLSCLLFKCCVKKYALDTETKTETRSINGEITGIRTRTGNGTTGNRTIRNCDEFKFYDSRWRAEFERPNLSSSTHTRTNNYAIPTISRTAFDDFSLQRQIPLHRPCWNFESRVAESDRLPISLSDPFSEPSNSALANAPSAPPMEWPLSLPSYEEVIKQSNYEIEVEPPPTYDEIILKINGQKY